MSLMRTLVVTSWFPSSTKPFFAPFVTEFIYRIARNGVEAEVFVPKSSLGNKDETDEPVTIYKNGFIANLIIFMQHLLKDQQTVVHVHAPNLYSSAYVVTASILGKPIVATVHRAEVSADHNFAVRFARRITLKLLTKVICVSTSTKWLAISAGCTEDKTVIIYNAVDESQFKPRSQELSRETLGLPQETPIVLFVGNLVKEKGCDILFRAFAKLHDSSLLLVIGDGVLRGPLEKLATTLEINARVKFVGVVTRERIPLYFNAADLLIAPSRIEGHSIAVLEALSSGIPVVATRVGGNVETIIHGESGWLVRPDDEDDLARALRALLGSPPLMRSLGEAGRTRYLQCFSEALQIRRTISIYHDLLKQ